jgi:hypothetical protein
MYLNSAQFVLSMFLTTFGLGQDADESGFAAADLGHACSMGAEPIPNLAMFNMTGEETLQADLDAADDLQLYTDPGGVLVNYMEIDSGTLVALRDFDDWTITATHLDGSSPVTWSRSAAGEAYFTFNVTTITEFEVEVTATTTTEAPKKKKIYIKVKPSTSTS